MARSSPTASAPSSARRTARSCRASASRDRPLPEDPRGATLGVVTSRDASNKLAALVERCGADLSAVATARDAGDGLAHEVGGELAFQWRVIVVRAVMAAPPDSDAVRE